MLQAEDAEEGKKPILSSLSSVVGSGSPPDSTPSLLVIILHLDFF